MKVLFYDPMVAWVSPHFETTLELMQLHVNTGDSIQFMGCNADLAICEPNFYEKKATTCLKCMSRRNRGLEMLSQNIDTTPFLNLTSNDYVERSNLKRDFVDINDLKKYYIDNFDIGYAAASSLIFAARDPEPCMADYKSVVNRLIDSAFVVYKSFVNHLDKNRYDKVYIFNGRYASVRGVLRACEKEGVECIMHERGCDIDHYALFHNAMPHNIEAFQANADRAWKEADIEQRNSIAAEFYSNLRDAVEKQWYSYVKHQQKGLLPIDWNKNKKNIVIFTSSEFELSGIGDEWNNELYPTQLEALARIIQSMYKYTNVYQVWLRVHPHLMGIANRHEESYIALEKNGLKIIDPESEISTYALIDEADKVVTFGSTVGMEAAYWGKTSILAGMSFYRDLGSVYLPRSHEELIAMLLEDLKPRDKKGALIYGYYRATFGIRFKYYKASEFMSGLYKNKLVEPGRMVEMVLKYAPNVFNSRLISKSAMAVARMFPTRI